MVVRWVSGGAEGYAAGGGGWKALFEKRFKMVASAVIISDDRFILERPKLFLCGV